MTSLNSTPRIRGVASIFKAARGMQTVLGNHLTGRKPHSVSMEVLWPWDEAGFAISLNSKDPLIGYTPNDHVEKGYAQDMLQNGYEFVPVSKAPEDLVATFSKKKMRVVAQYKGRKVYAMMGGLSNTVHYAGAGVVEHQAEPPAKIMRLAASAPVASPLAGIADGLLSALQSLNKPKQISL